MKSWLLDVLPTVIFESILHDVPVISTSLGGAFEILHAGKGGLLIPEKDINKSAKMILNYISNQKDILKRKTFAKEHLKKYFSKNQYKNNILSLFQQ